MKEHVIEIAGARIRITNEEVQVLSDPKVRRCPLRNRLYGHIEESRDTVIASLSKNVDDIGMFTADRILEMDERTVTFGASEMIADAMEDGIIDCAVTVCEGAGTIIVTRAKVMQAVGAHMTGMISTSPIDDVRERLVEKGCTIVDPDAGMDPVEGCRRALELGHRRIAVTVTGLDIEAARVIRGMPGEAAIFVCHNTGIGTREAEIVRDTADVVYACASRAIREVVGPSAMIQIGRSIPVFGMTFLGKRLILNRAMHLDDPLLISRTDLPSLDADRGPEPLH